MKEGVRINHNRLFFCIKPIIQGNTRSLVVLLLLLLMCGCRKHTLHHEYNSIRSGGWQPTDTLYYDIPITRTGIPTHLFLEVRHSNLYPYRDLNIAIESQIFPHDALAWPLKTQYVRYLLANEHGEWLGKGSGSSFQQVHQVGQMLFLYEGMMRVKVYHRMKEQTLLGIENVGVRLSASR